MHSDIDFQKLEKTLSKLENLFAVSDFRGLEQLTQAVRLSETEIKNALLQYPAELQGFNRASLDVLRVKDSRFDRWSVNVRFKRKNGDDSDLTLSLHVQDRRAGSELYDIEILDIHVL